MSLPTPTRESGSVLTIAPRPLRQVATEAVADIDASLERLSAWHVKVPTDSRLHKAREVLATAAATGVLVPAHRGDTLGLRALEIALDYSAIADTLPDIPLAAFRRELRDSLIGELEFGDETRGPLQLQSQALVRAAFVRAGVVPSHPTHSPRQGISSPDLLLENGTLLYAVEAKRPLSTKNVLPRFEDAHAQLKGFGLPGGILVDATDCLRNTSGDRLDSEVRKIALSMYDRLFENGVGHRPGYSDVMMAGAYARVAWDSDDHEHDAMVHVQTFSTIGIFGTVKNTLYDHRARWMRTSFETGLRLLNRTIEERHRDRAT